MALGLDIEKIIKYEGPNDVLVWKHPIEDFNTKSQLIVHESQEAILFKNGQALDVFGVEKEAGKVAGIIAAVYQSVFG